MRLVGIATFSAFVETSFKRITCEFSGACCFLCPAPTHTGVLCLSRSYRSSLVRRVAPYLGCSCLAMKPTAPLLALPCSGMKPPSPLRAMKGHFCAISTLQRCCRFQWDARRGVQRCCRFQSCAVIACYARKSSPCAAWCGCEREKVRPACSKWPKIGVLWRAGRSFSRNCCGVSRAGRVFSRMSH